MSITAAKLIAVVDGDVSGAIDAYDKVERRGQKSAGALGKVGKTMEKGIAVGAAAVAVGFGAAIITTMNFDKRMSSVAAKSGANVAGMNAMRDAAIDLGAKTIYSASEAADGMDILAAAGMSAKEIITAMPGALNAAAASGTSFASTADVLVATMGQFGKKAGDITHIGDVLAKSANISAVSMADLGLSLKYAGPVANALGVSLEETSAALVILGNNGIKADSAGTALRMGFLQLSQVMNPNSIIAKRLGKNLTGLTGSSKANKKAIQEATIAFGKQFEKATTLDGKLAMLRDTMKGMSKAKKVNFLRDLVGAEAVPAFLKLIDQVPGKLQEVTTELVNSDGAAKAAAATMTDNLFGSIEQLKGGVESAAIAIGTGLTPQMRNFADNLADLVAGFNGMSSEAQQAAIKNIALGASFAVGVLAAVKLGESILTIRAALIGLQAASGPVGLIWAAVGLLGGGLAMAGTNALIFSDGMNSSELTARRAADAVNGLKDALLALDDANLSNREATLGVKVAQAQLTAAHKATLDTLAAYGPKSAQYRAALLAEQQSELGVERAEQRKKAATLIAAEATRKAADATRKKASTDFIASKEGQKYVGALIAQKAAAGEIVPATARARAAIEKIAAAWAAAAQKADDYRGAAQRALSAGPTNAAGKVTQGRTSGLARKAEGGFSNGAEEILWGEAGRELILPLTNPRRTDDLLSQAGLNGGGGNVFHINVTTSSDDDRIAMVVKREIRALFSSSPSLA